MVSIKEAAKRAARIETLLKGKNPSPERKRWAEKLAKDHFFHLADLDRPIYADYSDEDEDD